MGAVDSIRGTWVTVCPPEKSSVWARSAADRPLAWPVDGHTVPLPPMPRPTAELTGTFVTGGPQ